MTAEVSLAMKEDKQTAGYLVPIQAILPAKEAGQGYAFVYDPQTTTVRKTPIKTLAAQNNLMIVSEGLSAGDIIAVAGVSFLADGMKVKLLEKCYCLEHQVTKARLIKDESLFVFGVENEKYNRFCTQ